MKKKTVKYFAVFMALNLIFEVVSPTVAMALTSGSIQPELTGFEPAGTTEMVDVFTGDFKYNIPLMEIDGYPLNLSYHAGQNMETEASWVGLGWSLNPGVLNRMVRGLPDDFNGDLMKSTTHMKPHTSMGVGFQFSSWLGANVDFSNVGAGAQVGLNAGLLLTYNNHKGYGIETQFDCNASLSAKVGPIGGHIGGGVGMTISSQDGATLSYQHSKGFNLWLYSASLGEGTTINTRTGEMSKTVFGSQSIGYGGISVGFTSSHTLPAGAVSYSPKIPYNTKGYGFGLSYKEGLWGCASIPIPGVNLQLHGGLLIGFKGFYSKVDLESATKNSNAYGYMYLENADDNAVMDFNRFRDGAITQEAPNGPMANKTYDIYSAAAQGLNTTFRPFRSDVGTVHDPNNYTRMNNDNLSKEMGEGVFYHDLKDVMLLLNTGVSGNWNTFINQNVRYFDRDVTDPKYRFFEKAYFKPMGELAARDDKFETAQGNENMLSPDLEQLGDGYEANNVGFSAQPRLGSRRDIRGTHIQNLTAEEADMYGFEKTISFYDNTPANFSVDATSRMVPPASGQTNILHNYKAVPSNSSYSSNNISKQISEVTVTNNSGSRYVYGIPVYNLYKKRVTFNASDRKESQYMSNGYPGNNYSQSPLNRSNSAQLVQYDPANDLSTNLRGFDNMYQADETPAYATNYLLTNILSTDYVDVTGNGPSYDDLGTFTKFNYTKAANFGWREPYGVPAWATSGLQGNLTTNNTNHANLDAGLVADKLDDKGMYEYGIRENYYLQSIETKNYVAFFDCSARDDYQGVSTEHGASSSNTTYKLDRIRLYSKSELIVKSIANAVPLKTVSFTYDYSLCPNTFNSNASGTHGKLTLLKVTFTNGSSGRSALSPYEFSYGDNDHDNNMDTYGNPSYNSRAVDRWGNYKPDNTSSGISNDLAPSIGNASTLNNSEFPYAEQDEDLANQYATAWNLTKIITPSNSIIEVTYEADDYSFIQNKQAGQMLTLTNMQETIDPTNDNPSGYSNNTNVLNSEFLIVDLSKLNKGIPYAGTGAMSMGAATSLVKSRMFKSGMDLYYKCFVKIGGPENSWGLQDNYWDFVPGYATVMDAGVFNGAVSGNTYTKNGITYYKYAFVRVKKEIAYESVEANPVSIAGWEFMRSFLPRVAYPGSEPANMGTSSHKPKTQFKNILVGLGVALADFVTGVSGDPNFRFYYRKFCSQVDFQKSFVRSYVPFKTKKGGGSRVKQILSKDQWDVMTGNALSGGTESASSYGQKFDYTTQEGTNVVSTGVAFYEPLVGGDEISLRKPIPFEIKKKFAPNDHLFQEEPYGEMLYPAGSVGYSKVTMTPIADPSQTSIYKIGKTVYEFYTAKDFPIIESRSDLKKQLYQNDLIEAWTVVTKAYKVLYATQGHVLKFNDMHGKLKAINTYGEDNLLAPISGAKYYYKSAGTQLVTTARTMDQFNHIRTEQFSRDIDVTVDNRSNINESTTMGTSFLFEVSLCAPGFAYNANAIYGYECTGLKTSVITKVVQQYGILEKVETFDEKSRQLTENLMWDRNSGDVVLQKTTNYLDKPVYVYTMPAYWPYAKMGGRFTRDGIIVKFPGSPGPSDPNWNISLGTLYNNSAIQNPELLSFGDEVMVYNVNPQLYPGVAPVNNQKYWVAYDNLSSAAYQITMNSCPTSSNTCNMKHFVLLDKAGNVLKSGNGVTSGADYWIKVIRPAERNQLRETTHSISSLTIPSVANSPSSCGPCFTISDASYGILHATGQTYCSGWNAFGKDGLTQQSEYCTYPAYYQSTGSTRHNPFISGMFGNWRKKVSFQWGENRRYDETSNQPNNRADGVYRTYEVFWVWTGQEWVINGAIPGNLAIASGGGFYSAYSTGLNQQSNSFDNWNILDYRTVYSPFGHEMEIMDSRGMPHAMRYGFNHSLPVLSAANAEVSETAFESFEDYLPYYNSISACGVNANDQTGFYSQIALATSGSQPYVTTAQAHSGRTSLYYGSSQSTTLTYDIAKPDAMSDIPYCNDCHEENHSFAGYQSCSKHPVTGKVNFKDPPIANWNTTNSTCTLPVSRYVVSFWVKGSTVPSGNDYSPYFTFNAKGYNVNLSSSGFGWNLLTSSKKSPIINGWQKFDYVFTIDQKYCSGAPNNGNGAYSWAPLGFNSIASGMPANSQVKLSVATNSGYGIYIDDFRVQPYNSSMTCTVYDPLQLRPAAVLDDNNYATYLEYDNEGMQVRKKRETYKGVLTLQETNTSSVKR